MASKRKKKGNPRIARKPRRTKEQIRRSKAALKGWQTRRINQLEAVRATPKKKLTSKQIIAEQAEMIAKLQKEISEKWVPSSEDAYLHRDGTIALYPSILRHYPTADNMIRRMKNAERKGGEIGLRNMARKIAYEQDAPIAEVYTLFMSP